MPELSRGVSLIEMPENLSGCECTERNIGETPDMSERGGAERKK